VFQTVARLIIVNLNPYKKILNLNKNFEKATAPAEPNTNSVGGICISCSASNCKTCPNNVC